jgi:peptidoglycan/LPS O-acetylase OafA/YrhL
MNALPPPKQAAKTLLISKELNRNNFDLLRFLLATCVIYSHCFVLLYAKMEDVEPLRLLTRNQVDFGGIAVSFFFVISGFLIVRSFEHSHSTYDYFVKRILRIVPGFAVAFLVSLVVLGFLGTATAEHKWGDWHSYFSNLNINRITWQFFMLEAPKGARTFASNPLPNRINDSLWTIQYEALCYLLVPLLGIASVAKRKGAVLFCFFSAYVLLILHALKVAALFAYDNEWNWVLPFPSELPRLFAFFFAGACVYLYRHSLVRSRYLLMLSLASLIAAAWWVPMLKIVLPVAGTYLLFYIAYHPHIPFHHFARWGDFSYGLYLYGWPIQQLIIYLWAPQLRAHGLFLVVFPLTLLAACGSWYLVEKPFLKMKKQIRKQVFVKQEHAVSV